MGWALLFILILREGGLHLSVVVTGRIVFLPVLRSSPIVDGLATETANHPSAVVQNHVLGRPLHELLSIVREVEFLLVWSTLLVDQAERLFSRPHVEIRLILDLLVVLIVEEIHV